MVRILLPVALAAAVSAGAQLSSSAYRVLGQPDLRKNATNMVQGVEFHTPQAIAIDTRNNQTHLYVADTKNSRILAWADVYAYQIGDTADLVLAQPGPQYTTPLGIGAKGLNNPTALAVDALGNLYVADAGDNRVVRYPSPFDQPGTPQPDAVFGQPDFSTTTPSPASRSTLSHPSGLALDSAGNLWVSDTGNHRVLRFNVASLNSTTPPPADLVLGQSNFTGGAANPGGVISPIGFDTPAGLAFDGQDNLYIADSNNGRVLEFVPPFAPGASGAAAAAVWGAADFSSNGNTVPAASGGMVVPTGVTTDTQGHVFVADTGNNRVVVFFPPSGPIPLAAFGQPDVGGVAANSDSAPSASANSLAGPADVKVDALGNVFVADTDNNRVVLISVGTTSASQVWGQADFAGNGVNQIKAASVNFAAGVAIDYSVSPFALYVSDTANNRVLVWKDSARFRSGDPADIAIGQATLTSGAANADTQGSVTPSATGLSAPGGLAVNPADGTLYVTDTGNNRVLRYPRPVAQSGAITPDAVIGQPGFTFSTAGVGPASLNAPTGVAIGPSGNLFVGDTGNNRVLEFDINAGNGSAALRVFGQTDLNTATPAAAISATSLLAPQGIAVDVGDNLYVADTGANRVVVYLATDAAPPSAVSANFAVGATSFATTDGSLNSPSALAIDSSGNIFVSDTGNNRVLEYPSLLLMPATGGKPTAVIGQSSLAGAKANWDSQNGQATADGLSAPAAVYLDRQDTLYVGDTGNSRLLHFLKPSLVVNAATFQSGAPVARGSLATFFGSGLAGGTATATSQTWPNTLVNRQITVNDGVGAPLSYMSATQANFQVPMNVALGVGRIAVRMADTQELLAGGPATIQAAAPGIFTVVSGGTSVSAVYNQDGTLNSASNPAAAGSIISLYGTGAGQMSPPVADGSPAPAASLSYSVAIPVTDSQSCLNSPNAMCVSFGNTLGNVTYTGLTPGYVGLWQVNVTVPQGLGAGPVATTAIVDGVASNKVTVAVK